MIVIAAIDESKMLPKTGVTMNVSRSGLERKYALPVHCAWTKPLPAPSGLPTDWVVWMPA